MQTIKRKQGFKIISFWALFTAVSLQQKSSLINGDILLWHLLHCFAYLACFKSDKFISIHQIVSKICLLILHDCVLHYCWQIYLICLKFKFLSPILLLIYLSYFMFVCSCLLASNVYILIFSLWVLKYAQKQSFFLLLYMCVFLNLVFIEYKGAVPSIIFRLLFLYSFVFYSIF